MVDEGKQEAREIEFHHYSKIFPLADAERLTELAEDMRRYGQHEPIVLFEGKILDGRNRYRACVLGGVEPKFVKFEEIHSGEDALEWLILKNTSERPMTKAQLAAAALDLLNIKAGGVYEKMEQNSSRDEAVAEIKQAANFTGAGFSSVERLVSIQKRRPDLIEQVRAGTISISQASRDAGFTEYDLDVSVPGVSEYFGKGDRFVEATTPLQRYLNGWRGRGFEFRHVSPKEARQRLKVIDRLMDGLAEAREDLEARAVVARSRSRS